MTSADIVFLIDPQNGFGNPDMTLEQGGMLYVPGSKKAGALIADFMRKSRHTTFVLSMDFHPDDIISDVTNHPGVQSLRKHMAQEKGIEDSALPFTEIYLREGLDGIYRSVGVVVGDKVKDVRTDPDGYILGVCENEREIRPTDLRQTLWNKHCVRGTDSALFLPEIMAVLPEDLAAQLYRHDPSPTLHARDMNGNDFWIVRKGMRRDVDSNALALENNGKSFTSALDVFDELSRTLRQRGVTHVQTYIGGLAGNICAELSHNNVHEYFVPRLRSQNITTHVSFITDISPDIPISIPDGTFPDADHSLDRMAAYGTTFTTTEDLIRSMLVGRPHPNGLRGHSLN